MSHSTATFTKPIVSIVLGSYQRLPFLKLTIDSVRDEVEGIPHEIIVVDGGSTDGSVEWLIKQKDVLLILQHNRGRWKGKEIKRRSWGYFMNLGFKTAQAKYICMISDDCLIVPGAIKNGIDVFEQALDEEIRVGAVAFYWRNWPEQSEYVVGLTWGGKKFVNHGLYLKEALKDIGYADEDNYEFYHADGDMALRLHTAGYICVDSPNSYVEHYSHANLQVRASNLNNQRDDWNTYKNTWMPLLGEVDRDWINRNYYDPHDTTNSFMKLPGVRVNFLKMRLINIKNRIKKMVISKILN